MLGKRMKPRIMFVELKTHGAGHDDNGPACISRVTFSKTGKMIYWREKKLQRGNQACGNHFDVDTGDGYWISGPKKNGEDRYPWAGEKTSIDPDVREEYWTEVRKQPERANEGFA
jgi:hypothetical protein